MQEALAVEAPYITVTELNNLLKAAVESEFPRVQFQGEISGLKKASSGHIYLTLKDENSQIPAVIWRGGARINFELEDGVAVNCVGKVTIYPAQGRLQVVIVSISPVGEGLLQKKLLELKKKLEKEGLFSPERKRRIPYLPKAVGVVTSHTGAVIQDIMVKIRERLPAMSIYLAPVRVQGKGSAEEIANGIRLLNRSKQVDVIIVGRGGGSKEDLWAFNEEVVVRAIVASAIPVISAVGHEVDTTLSDLVADARAPTPTAAAEMAVPKRSDLLARISELWERVLDYERRFEPLRQGVDELELRMAQAIKNYLRNKNLEIRALEGKVQLLEPRKIIELLKVKLDGAEQRLSRGIARSNERFSMSLKALHQRLEGVNPTKVLQRGYAILERAGSVVTQVGVLSVNDEISVRMATGKVGATVKDIKKDTI